MAVLTFDRTSVSVAIHKPPTSDGTPPGGAPASAAWPGVRLSETVTLVVSGDVDPSAPITLTKIGAAAWLTCPTTCTFEVPFTILIDGTSLQAYVVVREVLRASFSGYTSADLPIEAIAYPDAYAAPRARS